MIEANNFVEIYNEGFLFLITVFDSKWRHATFLSQKASELNAPGINPDPSN